MLCYPASPETAQKAQTQHKARIVNHGSTSGKTPAGSDGSASKQIHDGERYVLAHHTATQAITPSGLLNETPMTLLTELPVRALFRIPVGRSLGGDCGR